LFSKSQAGIGSVKHAVKPIDPNLIADFLTRQPNAEPASPAPNLGQPDRRGRERKQYPALNA
jgi:hypothetical protein